MVLKVIVVFISSRIIVEVILVWFKMFGNFLSLMECRMKNLISNV